MKRKAGAKLTRFDITQHLKDPEDAAVYLSQVLADGDDAERPRAFGHIARDQASGQAHQGHAGGKVKRRYGL
jgi:DNA-binding phage protein